MWSSRYGRGWEINDFWCFTKHRGKGSVPSMTLLEGGENFRRWHLVRALGSLRLSLKKIVPYWSLLLSEWFFFVTHTHTPAMKPHRRDRVNSHVLDLTKLSWNVAFLLWSWLSQTFHYSKWIQDDPYKDVKWNGNEETCILLKASYVLETSRTRDSSRRNI